jgi:hypothetical protein
MIDFLHMKTENHANQSNSPRRPGDGVPGYSAGLPLTAVLGLTKQDALTCRFNLPSPAVAGDANIGFV